MKTAAATKPSELSDSPYSQMKTKISKALKQTVQNAMHPSEAAKAILKTVTSDNPDFRYVVGKDASMMLETRRSMSEREFQDLIREQFSLQNTS